MQGRYLAGRLVAGLITLLVVTIVVFGAIHLVPGSYADIAAGPTAPPEARESIAAEYGLDEPLPVQYFEWLRHVAVGDFGVSLGTNAAVSDVLIRRLPVTIELTLLSLILTLLIGVPLAVAAGMGRGRLARGGSRLTGAAAISVPTFVLGSVLVYLFSRYELGLQVGGYVPFTSDPIQNLRSLMLPAITLCVFGIALVIRTGRDSVASVLSQPHVTSAIARGESRWHIVRHHVLRNAAIPVVTVLASYVGYLLGGAVIVENLFSLPGLGQAALLGINGRDYAIVQATVLVAAFAFIAVNMLADFSYRLIDPRMGGPRTA